LLLRLTHSTCCCVRLCNQDQGTAPFGDYKEIILAILDTYNYEDVLLTTTAHILAGDLYQSTLQQGKALALCG